MDSGKRCVNCQAPMPSGARTGDRGRDIAWMVHCAACAALAEDQMKTTLSRPTEAKIEVHRCDTCGTVQKITQPRPECRRCPPEEDSRTYRAKAGRPHHLYLVRYRRVCKFGHGTTARVREHLRAGADPVRVLRAPHQQVVAAETAIKHAYAPRMLGTWRRQPLSFGAGTEVLPANTDLDIRTFLNGAQVEDVTHRFSQPTAPETHR